MKKLILCFALVANLVSQIDSQPLPRRAFLGTVLEPVPAETAAAGEVNPRQQPEARGVLVQRVIPGSTAEKAKIEKGDVILSVQGQPAISPAQVVEIVRRHTAGEKLEFEILRAGKVLKRSTPLMEFPREQGSGFEVVYGEVEVDGAKLRTILTKPPGNGPFPALMFVQGVACYSLDSPFDTSSAEIRMLRDLTREGYVTLRVEKSGMGDSKGKPCAEIDFQTELREYLAALKQLKRETFTDVNAVFLFGHSMGGVMAPLMAEQEKVTGIAVYGTIGTGFVEYFAASRRTVAEAYGDSPAQIERSVAEQTRCLCSWLYHETESNRVAEQDTACIEFGASFAGRSREFWLQLNRLNLAESWMKFDGRLLALWGQYDFVSVRQEHEIITGIVNGNHPGNAGFVQINNAEHGMAKVTSAREALEQPGPFNKNIETVLLQWLNDKS